MPSYRENGLDLTWDGALTDVAPARVTISAAPAHPSNVVRVLYSLDGGAERVARGFPLDPGTGAGAQRFAVDLPLPPAGSTIRWRPVLSCSGREADPRRGGIAAETLRPETPPAAAPAPPPQTPAFPHDLQFLARVTAPLEHRPRVLGETPDGLRIVYPIGEGGTVRGPRLNGAILHKGGDWMRIRRDGIGVPEVRVLIRTDEGGLVMGEYSGVVDFGPDGYAALVANRPPARAWTQLAPRYVTAAPDLLWLNRLQCVAFGWVTMATLLVEYDLYAMRPGRRPMPDKVVILGGGVASMSAAHELLERGFEVEVYEKLSLPGGKARSIPVMEGLGDHGGKDTQARAIAEFLRLGGGERPLGQRRPWLPGEHGFRFFPNFYRHVTDTMARIPYGGGTVADNLVDTTQVLIAGYDKPGIELPSRFPTNAQEIATTLKTFLYAISPRNEIAYADIEHFAACVWRVITSCEERRFEEYERIGWWEFIGAADRPEAYQKLLGIGITRSLVAARAVTASTKTIGDIFVQLIFGILSPGVASDRLLNGPTNVVWIQPWLDHLRGLGLRYHLGAEVTGVEVAAGRVSAATVTIDGQPRRVTGDWFIGALPVERMAPLITPAMITLDPGLATLAPLSNSVQWMNGIQSYLLRDAPVTHGHVIFIDSPWALTSVSQRQFWDGVDFADWGDGRTRGVLSVDISQWDAPGLNGKAAIACTRQEIADEVWAQLKRSLNVDGQVILRDEDLHFWFLDPDIVDDPNHPDRESDVEPLLVNTVNTWRLRPEAATRIPNFMLASDYVRTWTDLATMEGANEAARRAVNAILERSRATAAPCAIWNLHEPDALAPLRAYDRARYRQGLPWDPRFARAVQAALLLGQTGTGITGGGAGPLEAVAPLADAASRPGGPLADPLVAQALSMIGVPPELATSAVDLIPGLGNAPPPEALSGLAKAAAEAAAGTARGPAAVRVTQIS